MCDVLILDDVVVRDLGGRALIESFFQDLLGIDGESVPLRFQQDQYVERCRGKSIGGMEG